MNEYGHTAQKCVDTFNRPNIDIRGKEWGAEIKTEGADNCAMTF